MDKNSHEMTRLERAAVVAALRDGERLTFREIGKRLGINLKTASDLYYDPDGSKAHERRHKRDGQCKDCGGTTHNGGSTPPERCSPCAAAHSRTMTRKWILDSIREWEELFGAPPTATDWNLHHARAIGATWKVERYGSTGRPWPPVWTVQDNFGSWRAAIEEAGYEPFAPGCYGRELELIPTEVLRERYEAGESAAQIARALECSGQGVLRRLRKAGVRIRGVSETQQLGRDREHQEAA